MTITTEPSPISYFLKTPPQYFSYIPPPFSAYHKARELWNNLHQNPLATPKSGGYVSAAFPACEANWVSSYKQPNSHSCDHLHVSEPEILLLKT